MKKDVRIIPVFNQTAPGIWDEFAEIQTLAGAMKPDMDTKTVKDAHKESWQEHKHNFAFGAYDNGTMIGYVSGGCAYHVVVIDNLFVLPNYQRQNIGHKLLGCAENDSAINNRSVDLVSTLNATPFYKRRGYRSITAAEYNHFIKNLSHVPTFTVMPVFYATTKITKACKAFSPEFDSRTVNKFHLPVFAYVDSELNVCGYSVVNDVNDKSSIVMKVSPYVRRDIAEGSLRNASERYCNIASKIHTR